MPDQIDLSRMESVVIETGGHRRLRRHWETPGPELWAEIWRNTDVEAHWRQGKGGVGSYGDLYTRYIRPQGQILEAGCGIAQVVLGLNNMGYRAQGLDFAASTLSYVHTHHPSIPLTVGDIRSLPFAAHSFDAYISLGVIEHFPEGQTAILREAFRILRPGGRMFVSVPCLNAYRKLLIACGRYKKQASHRPFFEDCYSVEELEDLLAKVGFRKLAVVYGNPVMTFVQESWLRGLYRVIEDTRLPRSAVDRLLRLLIPARYFGHMVMVVAGK